MFVGGEADVNISKECYTMYVLTSVLYSIASTLFRDTFSFFQFGIRTFLSRPDECLPMPIHIMRISPRMYR